jgi:23S rRNA (uracil1939-C5)-methyltransferase
LVINSNFENRSSLTALQTTGFTPALCAHFGVCGGCTCAPKAPDQAAAPPPYPEQLAQKEARVRQLLAPFDISEWRPIVPSPDLWYYRNKMEYAFGLRTWTERELVIGLRQAGKFDRVVDLQSCLLMSPESLQLVAHVRDWAKAAGLSGYDRGRHNGDLRYLVVREGKNTGERMALLIASTGARERITAALPEATSRLQPLLTTFWVGYTECRSDVARAEKMELQWGPGVIHETLNGVRYRISPYSFFQTNTHGTERLYQLLADWGRETGGALMDLYCGSGGIALSLANSFDRVVGVDINAEAIEDARHNATLNGCEKAEFVASDTEGFLKILPATKLAVQLGAAVIDPPRPGLQPKAMQTLLDLNPQRLAYVSCNPEALARDLAMLVPFYQIRSVQPVDLFPHTPHVETLVALEHR